jgi:hypothetical protein
MMNDKIMAIDHCPVCMMTCKCMTIGQCPSIHAFLLQVHANRALFMHDELQVNDSRKNKNEIVFHPDNNVFILPDDNTNVNI